MSKYRKKPVVIDAVQFKNTDYHDFNSGKLHFSDTPEWLKVALDMGTIYGVFKGEDYAYLEIRTLEGVMTASPGDWIIRGVKDELYPCKPDIFDATYEPMDDTALTYEELEDERDRLARELHDAQCTIENLTNEIQTLRNPTAQTIPTKFDLITTSAASHTTARCTCGGIDGSHTIGCPWAGDIAALTGK